MNAVPGTISKTYKIKIETQITQNKQVEYL